MQVTATSASGIPTQKQKKRPISESFNLLNKPTIHLYMRRTTNKRIS